MNKTEKKLAQNISSGVAGVIAAAVAAAGGWILFSRKYISHDIPLDEALDADRLDFESPQAGRISYYVDKSSEGTPLVLVHSINPAPSAYEVKPIFEHYRGNRPVYALDLPGFGFSERSDRVYSPSLYQKAISAFLKDVVGEPADVIAISLSCEFAALAVVHDPGLIHSMVMISPTGFTQPRVDKIAETTGQRGTKHKFYAGLAIPLWNRPVYDLVTSRPGIQYFLSKKFEGLVPDYFLDYAYQTAHQEGAQYAPTYYFSRKFFTPEIRETTYRVIEKPVLVIYDQDPYTSFEMLPNFIQDHENWKAARIGPTRGMPHWDSPQRVFNAVEGFWSEA